MTTQCLALILGLIGIVLGLTAWADWLDHKRRNSWLQASDDALRHAAYGDGPFVPRDDVKLSFHSTSITEGRQDNHVGQ